MRGKIAVLVLIVGPSGAGKDTLLDAARAALADDPRFRFVQRAITRAAAGSGEQHVPLNRPGYESLKASGAFFLCWEAHGLGYGIPADISTDLAAGRIVVASVSRGVIEDARGKARTLVIEITAPLDVLAARLAGRGREPAEEISERLARSVAIARDDQRVVICNDRTIDDGTRELVSALRRAAEL